MNEEFLFTPSQNHESDTSPECFGELPFEGMHHTPYGTVLSTWET